MSMPGRTMAPPLPFDGCFFLLALIFFELTARLCWVPFCISTLPWPYPVDPFDSTNALDASSYGL